MDLEPHAQRVTLEYRAPEAPPEPSILAIAAAVAAAFPAPVLARANLVLPAVASMVPITLGMIAAVRIARSKGRLWGEPLAVTAVALGAVWLVLSVLLLLMALGGSWVD